MKFGSIWITSSKDVDQVPRTIFVDVTANRSDTVNGEIKVGQISILPLQERHQEASETTIDVESDLVLLGQLTEVEDRVDRSVGEVGSGTDEHDSIGVSGADVPCKLVVYSARLVRHAHMARRILATSAFLDFSFTGMTCILILK